MKEKVNVKDQALNGLKFVSEFIVYSSVGGACAGLMRAVLPPGVGIVVKGGMFLGGMLIGGFVADKVTDSTEKQIDETAEMFEEKIAQIKHDLDVIREKENEETKKEDLG